MSAGYDVHTGEMKWRFHTVPQEGDEFTETWENDSWKRAGNAMYGGHRCRPGARLRLPTHQHTTNDYYGAQRLVDNLFAESLVCLDGRHR